MMPITYFLLTTLLSGSLPMERTPGSFLPRAENLALDIRDAFAAMPSALIPAPTAQDTVALDATFKEMPLTGWKRGPNRPHQEYEREWISPLFKDDAWPVVERLDEMQVPPYTTSVFRKTFTLSAEQQEKMKRARILLSSIDDQGIVFVNGWQVGITGDWKVNSNFNINSLLRVGENTVIVVVTNQGSKGNMATNVRIAPAPDATP